MLTIPDNVEIVHRLLTGGLETTGLQAVVGFSDGRNTGLQWAVSHPGFVQRIVDCAAYNLRTLMEDSAVHTCDGSTTGDGEQQPSQA